MSPRFLVVVTGCFLGLTVASGLVLVLVEPERGGTVTFIGVQGLAFMVFLRAVLVAAVPQADPARAASSLRRRQRWTAAGLLVGAITVAVGLALALDPLVAAVACVLTVGGLVLLVRALDRYAGRTARRRPVDAVRPGDEDRLAPAAIHATLLRRANLGLVTGTLVASLVGPLVGYFGSGLVDGVLAGAATVVTVAAVVIGVGSYSLTFAAGRRLQALTSQYPDRAKRLRKAVLRGVCRSSTRLIAATRRRGHEWPNRRSSCSSSASCRCSCWCPVSRPCSWSSTPRTSSGGGWSG